MSGHHTSAAQLYSRTHAIHHRKRQLCLTTAHCSTKRPTHIGATRVHRPRAAEYVLTIPQARHSILQFTHIHHPATRRIRDVPSSLRVVARRHRRRPVPVSIPAHAARTHVHERCDVLSERQVQTALIRGHGQRVLLHRVPPQVLPPRQRIRLTQAVVRKHKARVEPAIVLLLPHATLHHLHRPMHLPRVLRHELVATLVGGHQLHIIQLIDVQLRGAYAARHLTTPAVQRHRHNVRVVVSDLHPVVKGRRVRPPVAEVVHQGHVQTRLVGARLRRQRAHRLARQLVLELDSRQSCWRATGTRRWLSRRMTGGIARRSIGPERVGSTTRKTGWAADNWHGGNGARRGTRCDGRGGAHCTRRSGAGTQSGHTSWKRARRDRRAPFGAARWTTCGLAAWKKWCGRIGSTCRNS